MMIDWIESREGRCAMGWGKDMVMLMSGHDIFEAVVYKFVLFLGKGTESVIT